mmetsp:Transcript_19758/g.60882  ORF Transcript_19758/g.60882 Transcript_19758/m.60882 type:complete len:353 (-) Transcript_19758:140-1198(-)
MVIVSSPVEAPARARRRRRRERFLEGAEAREERRPAARLGRRRRRRRRPRLGRLGRRRAHHRAVRGRVRHVRQDRLELGEFLVRLRRDRVARVRLRELGRLGVAGARVARVRRGGRDPALRPARVGVPGDVFRIAFEVIFSNRIPARDPVRGRFPPNRIPGRDPSEVDSPAESHVAGIPVPPRCRGGAACFRRDLSRKAVPLTRSAHAPTRVSRRSRESLCSLGVQLASGIACDSPALTWTRNVTRAISGGKPALTVLISVSSPRDVRTSTTVGSRILWATRRFSVRAARDVDRESSSASPSPSSAAGAAPFAFAFRANFSLRATAVLRTRESAKRSDRPRPALARLVKRLE